MALSNRERVGKGMDLLATGLQPFVERELKSKLGANWASVVDVGRNSGRNINWLDPLVLLNAMCNHWREVFDATLGKESRNLAFELREVRNRWAHNEAFSTNDAHRALDSMARLLTATSSSSANEVEQMRMDLLRVQFDEQRRGEMRKSSFVPTEGKPQGGLKPWREVVTPHPDVASGRYQQAEFAADLWQVYQKEGSDEYKDPAEFFRRTFLTEGLKQLLKGALLRLAGKGGDPVVELQTNFGGGKTHSILALYHLFSGTSASNLAGVDELIKEAGVKVAEKVRRAVLVGTKISPGQPHKTPDGTVVRTLWGEIAWQLGGKEGYALIKEADETATNPGDALTQLFNKYSPCLILIDEWVAYARQLHDRTDLPAGTFETQFTFAQAVSESAKAAKNTLLVVSIPASESPHQRPDRGVTDIEVGGERGREALTRLKNAIGRVEASWRPASVDEGFEIVRRRLFQPLQGDNYVARDAVARGYSEMYGQQQQEFPQECREAAYERRLKMAYPIHPELFDRLFNDWSTLDKFQRTRGVLRLMAAVIHCLWERQDGGLLIMPASIPVDDPRVQFELTRYLEDQWVPVLEKDVDGPNSLPLTLDRENPNLGRYSACRRVARTIYMGSAPTHRLVNRGIDDRQVKLGCVQPGEAVATFGDSIRRLTDRATYLYVDGRRYWYSTQPSVARLADDRAGQLTDDDVAEELLNRLRDEAKTRAEFAKVHVAVSSSDLPDERDTRLVILGPDHPHTAKDGKSLARQEVVRLLDTRGASPRSYRNTLVFLAPDAARLKELCEGVRQYLAWSSICSEQETLNLDEHQRSQARTKKKSADETIKARIPETYQWLIVPGQPDPTAAVEWTEIRLQGQDGLASRAAKKLRHEALLVAQLGGAPLRHEIDKVPLWRDNDRSHVSLKQLADDFAKYLYLPRLKDDDVLQAAIEDGLARFSWQTETFAYAEGWDESKKRYLGLKAGSSIRVSLDGSGLLIRPDIASAQIDADQAQAAAAATTTAGSGEPTNGGTRPAPTSTTSTTTTTPPAVKKLKRFHGTVALDHVRMGRDAGRIAEEVIQHLAGANDASLEIVVEIRAEIPDGAPEKLVRDVSENCRTLRFKTFGFEE